MKPTLDWLGDTSIYRVNAIKAHSDHKFYETTKEAILAAKNYATKDSYKGMKLRQLLNGEWKFSYAEKPEERVKDFYMEDFCDDEFAKINVPGHIQLAGYDRCQYVNSMYPWDGHEALKAPQVSSEFNPVGSYVKEFVLDEALKGKRTFISFQGVETAFYVWLNGNFVGYSEDSFTPAEFEITQFLKENNRLCVEVYKRSTGCWLEDQDFWRFSGIFRDVYVYAIPDSHIYDVFVKTNLSEDYTNADLQAEIQLDGKGNCVIRGTLYDADGKEVASVTKENISDRTCLYMPVKNINLWSGERPYLYDYILEVIRDEEVIEAVYVKTGFRKFEMKNSLMLLNGKRIVFKGVDRHEFNCETGRVLCMDDMIWDAEFMKKNNINAVRTSHYPNQTFWYELCDKYGIYLIDEANLETHGTWMQAWKVNPENVIPGNNKQWHDIVVDRGINMLERDKNHSSVLIWSCGNESHGGSVIYDMSRFFKERDNTRLVHYEGVFHDRTYDETSDMESRMYAKPEEVREYLQNSPKKPYLSCEYMHAMGNSLGGLKLYTDLEDEFEQYQGGFIWDYIDQNIMVRDENGNSILYYGGDFDDRSTDYNFCGDGIIFADRTYSPKVVEVKHLYQNIRITPKKDKIIIENRNLFISTKEYIFEIIVLFNGEQVKKETFNLDVKPLCAKEIAYEQVNCEQIYKEDGETAIIVSAKLKEDTIWEKAGYEVAFGQAVFGKYIEKNTGNKQLKIVDGDYNLGIYGEGFSMMFSKQSGGMISYVCDGVEMIKKIPMPAYWRAPVDNDYGNKMPFYSGMWRTAHMSQMPCRYNITKTDDEIIIDYFYRMWADRKEETSITYTVMPDGVVKVSVKYPGVTKMSDMPLFGIEFDIPKNIDNVRWYGLGPEENYADRNNGVKIGIYEKTADMFVTPYALPQECGNITNARWVQVCDDYGTGIRIASTDTIFEFSVLPYSTCELENAKHKEELPVSKRNTVKILAAQKGVGGDDSWGAPVHKEFTIDQEKEIELSFFLMPAHFVKKY